jgi:tripartite ATP-independent transporter DctM subunit
MSPETIGLLGLLVLVALILIRVPIGVSLIAVSFVGTWMIVGERVAWGMLGVIPYSLASDWSLSSVPMFILMGYIAYHGQLTSGLFSAARVWLNNIPGGLAISAIFGATGFAAVTGSSVACSASMGRIAVPEMERAGYDLSLATGCVAAAGTIGALIPPSILLIIYGVIANVSITDLFVGGIIPGLLTGLGYIAIVVAIAVIKPERAPRHPQRFSRAQRLASLREVLPTLVIILFVFGGLFAGVFTPGQAGAVGSAFALLLCLLRRSIGRHDIWKAFRETLEVTTSLFIIVIGANLLTRFLAFSGAGDLMSETIASAITDKYLLLFAIACVYLVLGMFLDPLGAMLLTLPIFLPLLDGAGISALWFGVFLVKLLEVGMITPPIGLNVFVMQGVVGDRINVATIFRGVFPFILSDFAIVALMVIAPAFVLTLPALLN